MGFVLLYVWVFEYYESIYTNLVVTLLVVSFFISLFFKRIRQKLEVDNSYNAFLWLSPSITIPFSNVAASFIPPNVGLVLLSAPGVWIYWKLANKQPLLMVTAALTVGVACLLLIIAILKSGIGAEYLILPLPFTLYAGLPWVLAAWWALDQARRSRHRHLMGPAMESLTMFLLVVPLAMFSILSVRAATGASIWVAVTGIVIGVLFSSAVAEPFRQFLRALGKLDENHRGPVR